VIVVDASIAVEIVLQTQRGRDLARRLLIEEPRELHAPHLLRVEAVQTLRRLRGEGKLDQARSEQAIADLFALDVERHAHELLLPRAWELRDNLTIYDGVYVALAELLAVPLLTCDARIARAPGIGAVVEVT
jgi:predicted nucleic acid-binding protein